MKLHYKCIQTILDNRMRFVTYKLVLSIKKDWIHLYPNAKIYQTQSKNVLRTFIIAESVNHEKLLSYLTKLQIRTEELKIQQSLNKLVELTKKDRNKK